MQKLYCNLNDLLDLFSQFLVMPNVSEDVTLIFIMDDESPGRDVL